MVVGRKVISGDDQYARQTGKNVECKQNAKSSVHIHMNEALHTYTSLLQEKGYIPNKQT